MNEILRRLFHSGWSMHKASLDSRNRIGREEENKAVTDTEKSVEILIMQARIEERQFIWELINDIRYQTKTLESAKEITLDRLTEVQVEKEFAEKGIKFDK